MHKLTHDIFNFSGEKDIAFYMYSMYSIVFPSSSQFCESVLIGMADVMGIFNSSPRLVSIKFIPPITIV